MKKEVKNKKKSKVREYLSLLWSTEKGRAFLFFSFYALFFIFVIAFVRTSHSSLTTSKENEKETPKELPYSYQLSLLEKENYHYRYLVTMGEDVSLYEGDKMGKKELFTVTHLALSTSYYRDGDLFVKNSNHLWTVADNPYLFHEFYSISTIDEILKKAKFSSRTEYSNGEYELKFTISTKLLYQVLTGEDIIDGDAFNEIILLLDQNYNVVSIRYDLTNYYTYLQKVPQKLLLELSYFQFGEISEIVKP